MDGDPGELRDDRRDALTYSPISKNSNSMAGTALRNAGLAIPFSVETKFAPAVFTKLPRDGAEMDLPVR